MPAVSPWLLLDTVQLVAAEATYSAVLVAAAAAAVVVVQFRQEPELSPWAFDPELSLDSLHLLPGSVPFS